MNQKTKQPATNPLSGWGIVTSLTAKESWLYHFPCGKIIPVTKEDMQSGNVGIIADLHKCKKGD